MNNNTINSERNQEKNKLSFLSPQLLLTDDNKKPFVSTKVGTLSDKNINDLKNKLWAIGYTSRRMKVVETVLSFLTRYKFCYFKVSQIAQYAGVSHTTAESVLRDLQSMGLYRQDRRWRQHLIDGAVKSREVNSQWRLSDLFRDRNLLISLSYYFSFLKKFRALPLMLILSCSQQDSFEASRTSVQNFEDLSYIKDFIYKTGTDAGPRNERVTVGHPRHQYSHNAQSESRTGEYATARLAKTEKRRAMYAQSINEMRSLVLTDKGKAELSCFSDKAIRYTDNALYKKLHQESFSPLSAWKWFCKVATRYSKEQNLPLDYGLTFRLCADGDFKVEDANVQSVAQVKRQSAPRTAKTGREYDEKQPEAYTTTNEVVARVRDKVVSDGDKEHIEKKVKFFRASIEAAQTSADAQSRRCIPFYQIMLDGWEAKLAQLEEEPEPDNEPVMTKPVDDKQFLFGADDAPISAYDVDEESPWI